MGILSWIIFGAIAGWFATKLSGRKKNAGCFFNIFLGIAGAFVGGFIFEYFGKTGVTGFNFKSFFVAVIGAMVLIFIGNLIGGNKKD